MHVASPFLATCVRGTKCFAVGMEHEVRQAFSTVQQLNHANADQTPSQETAEPPQIMLDAVACRQVARPVPARDDASLLDILKIPTRFAHGNSGDMSPMGNRETLYIAETHVANQESSWKQAKQSKAKQSKAKQSKAKLASSWRNPRCFGLATCQ